MTGPAVERAEREVSRLRSLLYATQFVLGERERELLELKGFCGVKACRLHSAHAGPCDVIDSGSRTGDPVKGLPPRGHGWTTHGHWCCNLVEPVPPVPASVVRCMGPPGCSKCATEAVQFHMTGASANGS